MHFKDILYSPQLGTIGTPAKPLLDCLVGLVFGVCGRFFRTAGVQVVSWCAWEWNLSLLVKGENDRGAHVRNKD